MSKTIRRARLSKPIDMSFNRHICTLSNMPNFAKDIFNVDIHEHKMSASLSASKRRVVVGGRRTGKTDFIVLDALYKAVTQPLQKIIFVAPRKSDIDDIFIRIREYIDSSPVGKFMVTKDTQAPYRQICFANGSRFRGFALGPRSNVFMRGQDTDHIYIDEFFYCDKTAITSAVFPILQTAPGTSLTMVGTRSVEDNGWTISDIDNCDRFRWVARAHGGNRFYYTEEEWNAEILGEWDGYSRS